MERSEHEADELGPAGGVVSVGQDSVTHSGVIDGVKESLAVEAGDGDLTRCGRDQRGWRIRAGVEPSG